MHTKSSLECILEPRIIAKEFLLIYDPGPANLEEAIREYEERYAPSRASK